MGRIDHVTIRVTDLAQAQRFYNDVFELLEAAGDYHEAGDFLEWGDFSIAEANAEHPATRRLHIGFSARAREQIDAWWQALLQAGYHSDGQPGPRPEYSPSYYGAFILDRQGNSIEAVQHENSSSTSGLIDHLWIRVPELEPVRRFYMAVAPLLGLQVRDLGERVRLHAEGASFSLLEGPPTEGLHLALAAPDRETVTSFHATGLAAGGQDNGPPGERPQYHPGYYAAFLLDPAGTNLEAVVHDPPAQEHLA